MNPIGKSSECLIPPDASDDLCALQFDVKL